MNSLTLLEIIFLLCAVLGALLFLLRLGFSFFSAEAADFDPAAAARELPDVRHVGEGRFPLITQQGITAFLALFGLVGLTLSRLGVPPIISVLGGLAAGAAAMLVIAWLFVSTRRVSSDAALRIENTISQEAAVSSPIPAEGCGQVSLRVRGVSRLYEAISARGQPIPSGARVRILGVNDRRQLIVEPLD